MSTQQNTIEDGDLVEVTSPIPWDEEKPTGTRLIVDGSPYTGDAYDDEPGVTGPFYDVSDPAGMWVGGDAVPASHIRLVRKRKDLVPSARDIARSLHSCFTFLDGLRVREVGEESDDGECLYVEADTDDGVAITFLVRVGAVRRYDQ